MLLRITLTQLAFKKWMKRFGVIINHRKLLYTWRNCDRLLFLFLIVLEDSHKLFSSYSPCIGKKK